MSVYEVDAKVKELRELRNMEAEVKSAITAIEDSLKAEPAFQVAVHHKPIPLSVPLFPHYSVFPLRG